MFLFSYRVFGVGFTIPVALHGIRLQRVHLEISEDRVFTVTNQLSAAMTRVTDASFEVDEIADAIQDGEFEAAFQRATDLEDDLKQWFPEGLEPAPMRLSPLGMGEQMAQFMPPPIL